MKDISELRKNIDILIEVGAIKNEKQLEHMGINKMHELVLKHDICSENIICYFCMKDAGKCRSEDCFNSK